MDEEKKEKKTEVKSETKSESKIFLSDFLDSQGLTRAEKSYYMKHYAEYKSEEKTLTEWNKVVNFVHK